MPLLALGVAVHLDEWNADKYVPLVAIELSDHSEQAPYIRAYDSDGEMHRLPTEEAPDVPTVVVRMNERLESLGTKAGTLMYRASDYMPKTREFNQALRRFDTHVLSRIDYSAVKNDCVPDDSDPDACDPPGPPGSGPPSPCDSRDCKSGNDKIYGFKFYSTQGFKKLELWTDRQIELYVDVYATAIPLIPIRVKFGSGGDIHYNDLQNCPNNCGSKFYVANETLDFQWNEAVNGQYIAFRWMEEDSGATISNSYSYTPCDDGCGTVSFSYSQSDKSDFIGDELVEHSNNFSMQQNVAGELYFTMSR